MIDDLAWDNIWPVVTLVGGYALSRVDESRRRSHERLVAEDTRRRGFERDTYIELQDLLPTLQRETLDQVLHWVGRHREAGGDFSKMATARQDEPRWTSVHARAVVLTSRIADDSLRAKVHDLIEKMGDIVGEAVSTGRLPDLQDELAPLGHDVISTMAQLGERLRTVL